MLEDIKSTVINATQRIANWNMTPDYSGVTVEFARKAGSGDISTNIAMVVGKQLNLSPESLAKRIIPELGRYFGSGASIYAAPGFINITFKPEIWLDYLRQIMFEGTDYGSSEMGKDRVPLNIEYVSANPTGPLHIGHTRGAIYGDVMANLFEKTGFEVVREYYVNDAGGQIDALLESVYYRYCEMYKQKEPQPENFYPGEYVKDIAKAWDDYLFNIGSEHIFTHHQTSIFVENFREFVLDKMMEFIKDDLYSIGIEHDVFTYESDILANGGAEKVLRMLREKDLTYKGVLAPPKGKEDESYDSRKQLLFKSTDFGDDVDRPLKKEDGSWTYFMTDIAYHMDKFARGHHGSYSMIDIWGHDHAGYVQRVKAAMSALVEVENVVDMQLCQMVGLVDAGVSIKMSKRDNNFVTVKEAIDRVGKDALRFTMMTRKIDAQLTFDFQKAIEETKDNMVYYVHYAHARACSVLAKVNELPEYEDADIATLKLLNEPSEMAIVKKLTAWPDVVNAATLNMEPHRVAYYLYELSTLFHAVWNKGNNNAKLRFIVENNDDLTMARLILVQCVKTVLKSGLDVLGVSAPESM